MAARSLVEPDAVDELVQAGRAGAVGGQLGAEVGAPLVGLAHLRGELLDRGVVEHARLDHDALLVQRLGVGGHRAGDRPADVGVVGAAGGEAEQLVAGEHGRDHGDVGQVGAARVGVVEDPGATGLVVLVEHGGDRGGHRAEVDGDVLGLHDHLAARRRTARWRRRGAP